MTDSVQEILDITAWILGGFLFGLLVLGAYSFYHAYRNPGVPDLAVKPINKNKIQPVTSRKQFLPPEQLNLVKQLTPDKTSESPEQTNTPEEKNREEQPGNRQKLQLTELPFELLGTTTGPKRYEKAILRHARDRETRTLSVNEQWNDLKIVKITEAYVVLHNSRTDRREKLELAGEEG